MSEENVELVLAAYEAWNAGDKGAFGEFFADDLEYRTSGLFPDFDPVYRGRVGMLRFYDEMLSAWEYFRIDVRDVDDKDDWIFAALRFTGKGRASGVEVNLNFFHAARVANRRVIFLISTSSAEQALEAAGLSE
jgi:ketosteroid isomerase-like protein